MDRLYDIFLLIFSPYGCYSIVLLLLYPSFWRQAGSNARRGLSGCFDAFAFPDMFVGGGVEVLISERPSGGIPHTVGVPCNRRMIIGSSGMLAPMQRCCDVGGHGII